jgi:hypothetical protein
MSTKSKTLADTRVTNLAKLCGPVSSTRARIVKCCTITKSASASSDRARAAMQLR